MATAVDDDCPAFIYPELPTETSHMRLLTIQPAERDALHFRLESLSLTAIPDYIALSYAWGTEKPTEKIWVNGTNFYVRPNLHRFLTHITAKKPVGTVLFVDAVCIHQTDIAERESQVLLMRAIFRNASEVIAWLGPAQLLSESDSHRCLKDFQDTMDKLSSPTGLSWVVKRPRSDLQKVFEVLDKALSVSERAAILTSFRQPFWQRLWIVQEVILAQNLTMQFDHITLDPEVFISLYGGYVNPLHMDSDSPTLLGSLLPDIGEKGMFQIYDLMLYRRVWGERIRQGTPIRLYEAISRFYHQKSSEPRDKVFGLLGLTQSNIVPDYRVSLNLLYLYVFLEGLYDIHRRPTLESGPASWTFAETLIAAKFYQACMSTFQFRAPYTAMAILTNRALQQCGIRPFFRSLVLLYGWFYYDVELLFGGEDRFRRWRHGYFMFEMYSIWLLLTALLLWGQQCLAMRFVRAFNLQMTVVDGDTRTYADWMQLVDETADSVRRGIFPRSTSSSTANSGYRKSSEAAVP